MQTAIGIGGSRHLTETALVAYILQHFQARGWSVAVGCAPGIDAEDRQFRVGRELLGNTARRGCVPAIGNGPRQQVTLTGSAFTTIGVPSGPSS